MNANSRASRMQKKVNFQTNNEIKPQETTSPLIVEPKVLASSVEFNKKGTLETQKFYRST